MKLLGIRDGHRTHIGRLFDDGTVTSQIKRIRAKFVGADPKFDAIQTVYGMGYRWQAD